MTDLRTTGDDGAALSFLVPPLKIGPLSFPFPVIQAALSGYSDAPMRRMAQMFGCPFTLSEVFLDQFVMNVSKKNKARLYLAVQESDHPCGAQIMGSDPQEMLPAALRLLDFQFDLIDLNFACPVKKVLARGRGGALMADVPRALEIARSVRQALPEEIPLTVKLRKGYDDSSESRENFYRLLNGLIDLGITGITLHGRTVLQRYQGEADWLFVREVADYLRNVRLLSDFPLIGSGNLFTASICQERLNNSGVNGLAIARGGIGNPWIYRNLIALFTGNPEPAPPTVWEQRETIRCHWEMTEKLYGSRRTSTEMRKFLLHYAEYHPQYEELKKEFIRFHGTSDLGRIFQLFYQNDAPGVPLLRRRHIGVGEND